MDLPKEKKLNVWIYNWEKKIVSRSLKLTLPPKVNNLKSIDKETLSISVHGLEGRVHQPVRWEAGKGNSPEDIKLMSISLTSKQSNFDLTCGYFSRQC